MLLTATWFVIAFVTRFLPIAFTNSSSAIQGLHPELEEAVRIAGGNQARALWLVVLPILKKSLFGSWLLIFIIGTRELISVLLLVVTGVMTLAGATVLGRDFMLRRN